MTVNTNHLVQVVYFSDRAVDTASGSATDLLARMEQIHVNQGITGFLFAMGNSFVSVLEGTHDLVLDRMEQIARDPGHQRMVVLREGAIDDRKFGSWKCGNLGGTEDGEIDRREARAFASRLSKGLRMAL